MGGKMKRKKLLDKQSTKTKLRHKAVSNISKDKVKNKEQRKPESSFQSIRNKQLLQANEDEDIAIRRLGKLLKLNKRKRKKDKLPTAFKDDGLDYILDVIDKKEDERILSDCSDDLEEDFAIVKGKNVPDIKNQSLKRPPIFANPLRKRTLTDLMKEKGIESHSESETDKSDSEASFEPDTQEDFDGEGESENDSLNGNTKDKEKPEVWEDIYGKFRDSSGNVIQETNLYVPPTLQKEVSSRGSENSEEVQRLKKQIKGLLNRLSESNLQNICHQIEDMYMKNSRNVMNQTLFGLMSDLLFTHVSSPPRLLLDQAMVVALLHTNVGSEIGAYYLQHIVVRFQELYNNLDHDESKETNNLLTFLAHLYNFKVTHSGLIFDIFNLLAKSFRSKDIELIQMLLKNIGFVIRKDDPLKLKDLISSIQAKASVLKQEESDSRVRFMLDILMAIRNNNMYKIPDYDPSLVERSKKLLRGYIRKGNSMQELAISYEDLMNADKKGRWWIVGSAWSEDSFSKTEQVQTVSVPRNVVSEKMLDLAQKQHMNTEIRKAIFCVIMSAEDFMDAFEKLLRLNLKNEQEREIIHVLIHCVLNEKVFNPYYAFLAGKFCSFARKFQIALQFSLWDKFKELNNMKPHQLNNLSCFLGQLLISGALALSVLKVIHFSDMNKRLVRFFRQILMSILLHEDEEVVSRVFQRIATAENLKLLREGLRLFMLHFLLRNQEKMEPDIADKLQLKIKLAENILNSSKSAFKL